MNLELVTETLKEELSGCLINATSTADANILVIFKSSPQNLQSGLAVVMLEPHKVQVASMCKGTGRNHYKQTQKDSITHFRQLPGKRMTKLRLGKASEVEEYMA